MKVKSEAAEFLIWLAVGVCFVAAIWSPFGFSMGGLIEEWDILGLFTIHGTIFYIDASGNLPFLRGRPLTFFPQAVAYSLDQNSFFYWHVLMAGSLVIKFVSSFYIGRFMTQSRSAGLLIGALTLLFPADTMQINLRAMHIDFAVALAVGGGAILLGAQQAALTWLRIGLGLVSAGLFVVASLIYEAVLPLSLIPVVALYVRYGFTSAILKLIDRPAAVIIWGAALAGCLVFIAVIGRQNGSYQASLVGQAGGFLDRSLYYAQTIVFTAFYRSFLEAWMDIYTLAWAQMSFRVTFLIFAAVLAIGFYVVLDQEEKGGSMRFTDRTSIVRLLVGGLGLFVAGYAPFLLSVSHVVITQRTFVEAASGGAMVIAAAIMTGRLLLPGRLLAVVLAAPVVAASLLAQIYQHDQYNRIYADAGRPMIQAIATIAEAFRPGEPVPIVSKYGSLTATWDFGVPARLMLVYLKPDAGYLTLCDGRSGRMLPLARPLSDATCAIEQDGLSVVPVKGAPAVYSRFAVIETDGSVTIHDRAASPSVQSKAPIVPAVLNLGNWSVADSWFNKREPSLVYECKFESMWGYAVPCRTFGMYEGEFVRTGREKPRSFSWVNDRQAGLMVGTLEKNTPYRVIVDLEEYAVTPDLARVRLTFNDSPLTFRWTTPRRLEADIAAELVADRVNVLGLEAPLDNQYHLSVGLNQVRILKR